MGEMADWALEQALMDWDGIWDDDDIQPPQFVPYKTCRYCGEESLVWQLTPDGWRLATDEGELHECKVRRWKRPAFRSETPSHPRKQGRPPRTEVADQRGLKVVEFAGASTNRSTVEYRPPNGVSEVLPVSGPARHRTQRVQIRTCNWHDVPLSDGPSLQGCRCADGGSCRP